MERRLDPLIFFGVLGLIIGLLFIVPEEETLAVLVYLPVLVIWAVILYKKSIKSIDPDFPAALFTLAFLMKLGGSILRYWTGLDLYGGAIDAQQYHENGLVFAGFFRQFDFSFLSSVRYGTQSLDYLTGLLYTILPSSLAGSFFFFGMLAFTGSVFFYRAHRVAFPEARPDLFRLIIFFLPSILFWPSSLGKDAWVFFGSGFVAYGLVKLMRQSRLSGLMVAILGVLLVGLIRPHVSLAIIFAAVVAFALQGLRSPKQVLGGVAVTGLAIFLLQTTNEYFYLKGLSDFSWAGVQEFYIYNQQQTFQGGSRFTPIAVFTLLGPVYALVTVLFRPFPWEAGNAQSFAVAVEGIFLLGLAWYNRQTLLGRIKTITRDPWIAFLVVYSIVMIISLTTIANFGILARQRVMFLPFIWMLFA